MQTHTAPIVGIHLDLKYVMPRKEYLHRWLREIAGLGINVLLLEYEDKFPFEKYPFLRAEEAFTPDELRSFLTTAREAGISVIPLVQTLSHLEFALAHEELAHLREAPDILTQINPSNPEACRFIRDLIEEFLPYHQEDEYFHLGADETWFVGTNPSYAPEVEAIGLPAYWAKHMRPYIEQVMQAGKRPMVWDDVLWKDPHIVTTLGLPRELILVSWDYALGTSNVTQLDFEESPVSRVDVYRKGGFDVLGAPCLNWGVLAPRHDHVLKNTAAWAKQAQDSGLMGLLNTSWSVFHTPLSTQMPYISATAELLNGDPLQYGDSEQVAFCERFFGVADERFPDALRNLSLNWEHTVEGFGRPITPMVYSYMDVILHYGSQVTRMKHGSYPFDWNDVDFNAIYGQKISMLRQHSDQAEIGDRLVELEAAYALAKEALDELALRARLHREEAELLACFAVTKQLHVRTLKYLLREEGDGNALLSDMGAHKVTLQACLTPFHEPASVQRLIRLWWEPAAAALAAVKV